MTQQMITSAQLKLNPDDYAPFVPDMDVVTYCSNHVDPFYEEIEHIGIKAVVDAIINPAGIAIEYLYLDRSPGDEVTPYSFPLYDEKGNERKDVQSIRLLYRPLVLPYTLQATHLMSMQGSLRYHLHGSRRQTPTQAIFKQRTGDSKAWANFDGSSDGPASTGADVSGYWHGRYDQWTLWSSRH